MRTFICSVMVLASCLLSSCNRKVDVSEMIDNDLLVAGKQLESFASRFDTSSVTARSWKDGEYRLIEPKDWTSGFFPGSLWLYYELSGDLKYKDYAMSYTAREAEIPFKTNTHDLGFMVFCSYGKQQEVLKDSVSASAIVQASKSLISRFNPQVGLIRSWDFGEWNYPVIIDNMMNLEMLFWASEYTGDPVYREIAVKHADKTLANHFRPDASSYHVVSYNDDGTVQSRGTYQGYSDDSAWARGQAWALYGYTMCFRYTGFERYLAQAEKVASFIMNNPSMPKDKIPYWDYNAPKIPDEPRDASAAAVTASALFELSTKVDSGLSAKYFDYALGILKSLSSDGYLAKPGENGFFILKHSTGAASLGSEIDVPLNYADYYFLEAIKRYKDLKK